MRAAIVASATASGDRSSISCSVDPPSFSTARDAGFAIDRDYARAHRRGCGLVAPGGLTLWWPATHAASRWSALRSTGRAAAGRRAQVVSVGGLPPDYPTELADADARYLQTCLLRVT